MRSSTIEIVSRPFNFSYSVDHREQGPVSMRRIHLLTERLVVRAHRGEADQCVLGYPTTWGNWKGSVLDLDQVCTALLMLNYPRKCLSWSNSTGSDKVGRVRGLFKRSWSEKVRGQISGTVRDTHSVPLGWILSNLCQYRKIFKRATQSYCSLFKRGVQKQTKHFRSQSELSLVGVATLLKSHLRAEGGR